MSINDMQAGKINERQNSWYEVLGGGCFRMKVYSGSLNIVDGPILMKKLFARTGFSKKWKRVPGILIHGVFTGTSGRFNCALLGAVPSLPYGEVEPMIVHQDWAPFDGDNSWAAQE